jgi:hypothetical protein
MILSEAAVDKPFLYEKGWGKKQSYCLLVGYELDLAAVQC